MSQQCNTQDGQADDADLDLNIIEELDVEGMLDDELNGLNVDSPLAEELDDAYAYEYFRKFEPDPNYDRNALPPDDDGSPKSGYARRKYFKERGLSYVRLNGIEQPPRQIKEACVCRRLCYMKFLDDVRNKLLSNLMGLSATGQFMFLSSHITSVAIQRPKFKYCPRKSRHMYYFPANSGRIQVCMRMFVNTFDISDKQLRILNEKIEENDLANKSTPHEPNDDLTPPQSASNGDEREAEPEPDTVPEESHANIDFVEIPQMRDLGDMEEYFLRYEIDREFHSRLEQSILRSRLGKQSAQKTLTERLYQKAKGYRYIRQDGLEVPARRVQPACSCRALCSQRMSNDARQILLNNLLNMSVKGQGNFLCSHMHLQNPTHQRNFYHHFLPTTSGLVRVCKVMFLNTYDLSERKMRVLLDKRRRENQEVLGGEDGPKKTAAKVKLALKRKEDTLFEEDTCDDFPKTEADDQIEIEHSYDILKEESEDGSNDSNSDVDVLKEALENPEQHRSTVVSSSESEVALDDDFLDQYFRRYETKLSQEDASHIKRRKQKDWIHTEADNTYQPCSCVLYGCSSWFTEDLHQKLFSRYARLSTLNKKRFLYRHIRKEYKQVQRGKKYPNRRVFSQYYFLPTKKGHVKVCKVMFMNTFKVTDRGLRTILGSDKFVDQPEEDIAEEESPFGEEDSCHDGITETCDDFQKNEADDQIEMENAYDLLKEESEDGSIDSNDAVDSLKEALANPEQYSFTVVSNTDSELALDDDFLDQYFHKYETNLSQEGPLHFRGRKPKVWVHTEADNTYQPCSCILYGCYSWFTEDLHQKLFARYARLSTLNKKRFLYRHIRKEYVQRGAKYPSRRNFSQFYFLPTKKGHVKVCKVMFMNTFKITDRSIRTILDSDKFVDYLEENATEEENLFGEEDSCGMTGDHFPSNKADNRIEIEHSYGLLKEESEDGTIDSNSADDGKSVPALEEVSGNPEQYNFTVVSNSNSEAALDDAFLDQYFRRYETNLSQKEAAHIRRLWHKNWVLTEADNPYQPCSCITYGCSSWFTADLHQKLFSRYVRLSTLNKKLFLYRHIRKEHKQGGKECPSRRIFTQYYFLPTKKGPVKVCKVMFMNTFKVTDRTIRSILDDDKFVDHPEEDTTDKENPSVQEEPDDVVDADISFGEEDSCDVTQGDADGIAVYVVEVADSSTDSVKNSLPLDARISQHSLGGCNEGMKTESSDETEINSSHEVFKSQAEDGTNENNSMVVDDDLDILALNEPMENTEQVNFETISQMEEESDDVFLDQYFYRYETNFGQEEPTTNKDKSMRKWWSSNDADGTPPEPCACTTFNCSSWFTDDLRQKIFTRYARLSAVNKKRFLFRHIRKEHKRRTYRAHSRRIFSMFYFIPTKKGYVKVCKVMFMNTFKVTDKKIRTIISSEKFSEPSEEPSYEDQACIKLNTSDILMDIDETSLGEVSNDISSIGTEKTDQLNPVIEIDPESCSPNQYSNVTDDSTESCEEDNKLPSNDIDSVVGVPVTGSKQLPIVQLDDEFLAEYFRRYETNLENQNPESDKPGKVWIKHDTSGAILPRCSCLRRCSAIYPDDVRQRIYTRFTKLSSLNQKRFLYRHIRLDNPHRKRGKRTISRRQNSWFYYLPAQSGHFKVCRVMFINTFNVTEKKLRILVRRKEFAEDAPDEDDQNVSYGSPCDDQTEDHNLEIEGTDNAECENYFAEVAESAVEPLLSILGCSVARDDTSTTVAELDENFLDEYFHNFGRNVPGENRRNNLDSHRKTFSASKILPPIACACSRKCHIKFADKIRQMILERYTELSIENRVHILKSLVKRETWLHSEDDQSDQSLTCSYYLPSKSGQVRVCNIMFLNTFNINENELRELIFCEAGPSQENVISPAEIKTEPDLTEELKIEKDFGSESESTEMIVGDYEYGQKDDHSNPLPEQLLAPRTCEKPAPKEGNADMCIPGTSRQNDANPKQPQKINNGAVRFAKEHICSFPRITSHFCQAVNKTKYLSCFLDVTSMYIAYINACTESSKEPVPSKVYNAILQKERIKDPALPSVCDSCQHEETFDPGEGNDNFWYEDA